MTELVKARGVVITKIHTIKHCTVGDKPRTVDYSIRNSHSIQLRLGGSTEFIIGKKRYKSEKNDLIYLPKGLSYSISSSEPGECLTVNFDTADEYLPIPRFMKPRIHGHLAELFERAILERRKPTPSSQTLSLSTVYTIIALYQRTFECEYSSSRAIAQLKPAIDMLESGNDVTVEELALSCNVSTAYFRRRFAAVYGMTPRKYLITSRIERAKHMLDIGKTIKYAAETSGYNDVSYFSKVFKRETNMTPSEYSELILREL